jgi:HEAT repeat protein
MRPLVRFFLAVAVICAVPAMKAQPKIVHAQLTTEAGSHGLSALIHNLTHQTNPQWVGYSLPVVTNFSSGWNERRVVYLEGDTNSNEKSENNDNQTFDHAIILLRIAEGSVVNLRIENPNRELDAGGATFTWVDGVGQDDSVKFLADIAHQSQHKKVRDDAIFAISLHQGITAIKALADMTAASNELDVREKAAFWLANQRGHDGLIVIERLAREDGDARFREKLTFDLTLSKEPAALDDLIRMAHSDASPQVRRQAQFWMANKGGKKVTDDLRQAVANDPEESVRKSAVFALSRLPEDEAATQLIAVADTSKDAAVRKQAIFWLAVERPEGAGLSDKTVEAMSCPGGDLVTDSHESRLLTDVEG